MILIDHALKRITDHAEQGYPSEVVGILAGDHEAQTVSQVVPLTNLQGETHNRYLVDGKEQWQVEQQLEDSGYDILGYYHSHPDHPSQFSQYDQDHALPNMNYLIIAVQQGRAHGVQTWRLRDDRSTMDEIETRITQQTQGEHHDY